MKKITLLVILATVVSFCFAVSQSRDIAVGTPDTTGKIIKKVPEGP